MSKRKAKVAEAEEEKGKDTDQANKRKVEVVMNLKQQEEELKKLHQDALSKLGGATAEGTHIQFLLEAIAEKETALECPVCQEEASPPIYGCSQFHVVCATCRADERLAGCPACREEILQDELRISRFVEERAGELGRLRGELRRATS